MLKQGTKASCCRLFIIPRCSPPSYSTRALRSAPSRPRWLLGLQTGKRPVRTPALSQVLRLTWNGSLKIVQPHLKRGSRDGQKALSPVQVGNCMTILRTQTLENKTIVANAKTKSLSMTLISKRFS